MLSCRLTLQDLRFRCPGLRRSSSRSRSLLFLQLLIFPSTLLAGACGLLLLDLAYNSGTALVAIMEVVNVLSK